MSPASVLPKMEESLPESSCQRARIPSKTLQDVIEKVPGSGNGSLCGQLDAEGELSSVCDEPLQGCSKHARPIKVGAQCAQGFSGYVVDVGFVLQQIAVGQSEPGVSPANFSARESHDW